MTDLISISDDDLVLLYYGEQDDPQLAAAVARSDLLTARFEALSAELRMADAYQPPERDKGYGESVWRSIAPRLEREEQGFVQKLAQGWRAVSRPRFSFAGMASVVLVALLAFALGQVATRPGATPPGQTPVATSASIDPERLLAATVGRHLEQLDQVLTEFVNTSEPGAMPSDWATDMLVANRLYRQSATARGDRKLAGFLADIEPLLIEMAYEAQVGSGTTFERMQDEVRNKLLFRVRVMNTRLNQPQIRT